MSAMMDQRVSSTADTVAHLVKVSEKDTLLTLSCRVLFAVQVASDPQSVNHSQCQT